MFTATGQRLQMKSAALLVSLETRLDRILQAWLLFAGLACAARIAIAPTTAGGADLGTVAPYLLLILAPFASTVLALRWFADGDLQPQPATRLARLGRWRTVSRREAGRHPLFGTSGIMVSLLVGMMINVPLRAVEFLAAMPPVPPVAPQWLSTLSLAMTFDVVLFTSLYMIAFVAALRRVPLFPRLLAAIWVCDVGMQLAIANAVAHTDGLPAPVASALHGLLEGNIKKVLISAALWLPYLLLSTRVNVTFRNRVPA
ncbi:MAG: DUF2569 domain-containing protein [Sphingomicrobium sp.]